MNDAGDSGRTARYAEYKSTREKLDDELQADFDRSLERIEQLLDAMGLRHVAVTGWEADDVIGTLAVRAAAAGLQAVIVSGDKDFHQLVAPGVALLNPGRGGPAGVDEQWVDESNGSERLGVLPSQVVDYLALVGDSSDNVPGVKGIGDKGAQKLLAEWGSLDAMLANPDKIEPKRAREALQTYRDEAILSRELVTIKRDVPVEVQLDEFTPRDPDYAALTRVLTELEFHSLVRKLVASDASAALSAIPASESAAPTAAPATAAPVDDATVAAVESGAATSTSGITLPTVTVIDTVAALPTLVARLRTAPIIALDTETSSLEPHDAELIGLSVAISPTEVWYLPFGHRPKGGELAAPAPVTNLPPITDPALAPLADLLRDPTVPKTGHNIKYDWQVLRRAGLELAGVTYDTMLASFVLDATRRSHAVDTLAFDHLGVTMQGYHDVAGKGKTEIPFAEVDVAAAAAYCGADSAMVLALREIFEPELDRVPALRALLRDVEMPLVGVLADMEWDGIAIDRALFRKLSETLLRDLQALEAEIGTIAGETINLNSPKQLATVLFEKQQLPVLKKTKTGPSTDADVLEQLAAMGHVLPTKILEYRELQKLRSTYVETLPSRINHTTGRIHTSFNQAGAATGRMSSSEPNLQNIPIRTPRGEAIRKGFVPTEGRVFVVADYSQIELRLMAHLSEDPAFVAAFQAGDDIHRQTAAIIFGVPLDQVTAEQRARAKTINFGTIYGQGPFALSKMLGISQEDAKAFITQYFERFAGVRAFLDRQVELARDLGYVETIFGRRRYIPEAREKNFNLRSFGERTAGNSPLQGSAADLIKLAMVRIHDRLRREGLEGRMLLQVHDELVFEAPEAEVDAVRTLVKAEMEGVHPLRVPLVVDIGVGPNWLDAKH